MNPLHSSQNPMADEIQATHLTPTNTPAGRLIARHSFARDVMDWVLPPSCRLCDAPASSHAWWCEACHLELHAAALRVRETCHRCALPIPAKLSHAKPLDDAETVLSERLCVECADNPDRFGFDRAIAAMSYQGQVCRAVVAAKYRGGRSVARALAARLGDRLEIELATSSVDGIVFVPSHRVRAYLRGGNGVRVLAEELSKRFDWPIFPVLRTTRRIAKQAWLDDRARRQNVSGAFGFRKSYAWLDKSLEWSGISWRRHPHSIAGRHLVVVDDVLTTGATGGEIARTLKSGGARRVTLVVVARAIRG
ncbi:MAG: phosphoribosyltransferase family protein [Planctomycetota bacterium]